jgi:hypothetical protein
MNLQRRPTENVKDSVRIGGSYDGFKVKGAIGMRELSPTCCSDEYDLSLEMVNKIVDISNLVNEGERDATQVKRRTTEIAQRMMKSVISSRKNGANEEQRLYPPTEVLDEILEVNADLVLRKITSSVNSPMRQRSQLQDRIQKEAEKNELVSRTPTIQPHVELPSSSSRRPSVMQRPRRSITLPDRNTLERNTSDRSAISAARSVQTTMSGRSSMSYEEARAAAAAASRQNEERRLMAMQQPPSRTAQMPSYDDARGMVAMASRQSDEQRRHNAMPSYEEARAAAAAASRRHDERNGIGSQRAPPISQKHSLQQGSFRRLEHLERSLSNRSSDEEDNYRRALPQGRQRPGYDDSSNGFYQNSFHGPPQSQFSDMQQQLHSMQQQQQQQQQPRRRSHSLQIEIAPGVWAPLRGAEETLAAVEDGNVEQCECILCTTQLLCIADAEYVLCPECKVVIPLPVSRPDARGVGLGMLLDEYSSPPRSGNRHLPGGYTNHPMARGGQFDGSRGRSEDRPRTYNRQY